MTLADTGTGTARLDVAPRPGRNRLRADWLLRGIRGDLAAIMIYLAGGFYVTARLWYHLGIRVPAGNAGDSTQFEWMLAHGARVVFAGQTPFFTHRMNVPLGVNLMANTSVLGLSVPLAPITWLLGPDVSFALLDTLALALTAAAWYVVLRRYVVRHRLVAFVIAGLCGFAPGLISHAAGQPNLVAQFLLPIIGARVIWLAKAGQHWLRDGIIIGLLVAWQALINEELLLFTAGAMVIFVGVLALSDRRAAWAGMRPFLAGMAVAVGVAGAALAYPLVIQFTGPGRYQGLPFDPSRYSTDLATYFTYSRESLGGGGGIPPRFVLSPTEENSFLGWPLLALTVLVGGWLWRDRIVRAAGATALVFALLSLGSRPMVHGVRVPIPGPYTLLTRLSIFDLVTPGRLSLVVVPFVGLILARGLDRAAAMLPRPGRIGAGPAGRGGSAAATSPSGPVAAMPKRDGAAAATPKRGRVAAMSKPGWVRLRGGRLSEHVAARRIWVTLWVAAVVAALVPVFPTPLAAVDRPPVPGFFASGAWRAMVPAGRSAVAVPLPRHDRPAIMWWQADQLLAFRIAGGYFLGPTGPNDPTALFGPPPRPTALVLAEVDRTGVPAVIGPAARAQAVADLRYWRAAIVVLASGGDHEEALWVTVTALLGARPQWRDGVWVWDVRETL